MIEKGDLWCNNLVRKFSKDFLDMNSMFGGNAAKFGLSPPSSLDLFLLPEDVANLAILAYKESIKDHSLFSNPEIVRMYFNDANTAITTLKKMFHI